VYCIMSMLYKTLIICNTTYTLGGIAF
jgi:hypothetical protein